MWSSFFYIATIITHTNTLLDQCNESITKILDRTYFFRNKILFVLAILHGLFRDGRFSDIALILFQRVFGRYTILTIKGSSNKFLALIFYIPLLTLTFTFEPVILEHFTFSYTQL